MTGLQLAIVLGAVLGLAAGLLLYLAVPAQPDLADVLTRLSPAARRRPGTPTPTASPDAAERLGIWAQAALPARLLGPAPARDLAVLRRSPASFYGRKIGYGLLGLVLPGLLTGFFTLIGIRVPVVIPAGASIGLAVVLFLMPTRDLHHDAVTARTEIARALSAYIELVALERASGAGPTVALANAARVGDSWIFAAISQELARSRYNGQPPWDALAGLAEDLAVPEIAELADIMRLAGDESTEVYQALRARSAAVRSALLSTELTQAGVVEERMYLPASLLGVVFLALLITPPLLRLFGTT